MYVNSQNKIILESQELEALKVLSEIECPRKVKCIECPYSAGSSVDVIPCLKTLAKSVLFKMLGG